jgi:signal transduction histidine kinase
MAGKLIPIPSEFSRLGVQQRDSALSGAAAKGAASLAHEINNPLNVLLNLLYLTEQEASLTQKGSQYLLLAREEIDRISDIAHAALNGGGGRAAPKQTNVPQLLASVLDLYKSRLDSQDISIETRYPADGDLAVHGDRLRQAFSNLLLNAADAMPEGGRLYVRVSAAHEWSGQRRRGLRVLFADSGSGIAADKLRKISEPCFTTKASGGRGFGLSVVNDVVQQHQGVLRVRSNTKPGHSGSVFAIFLPEA